MDILRWPWVVCATSFVIQIYVVGVVFTFGTLLNFLKEYFDVAESEVALIGSLQAALTFCSGFMAQPFRRWFSSRTICFFGIFLMALGLISSAYCDVFYVIFLTYGGFVGAGTGIVWLTAVSRLQEIFRGSRPLASGIAAAGGGAGVMALSTMRNATMQRYGWQHGLLIELVFVAACVPCVIIINMDFHVEEDLEPLVTSIVHSDDRTYGTTGVKDTVDTSEDNTQYLGIRRICANICKNPLFPLSLLFCSLAVNGMLGPTNLLPSLVKDKGGDIDQSSVLVMVFGISNIISRIFSGITGNYSLRIRATTMISATLLGGGMTCAVSLWNSYGLLILYALCIGASTGNLVAMMPVLLTDFFGPKYIQTLMSFGCATLAVTYLVGQPLLGLVSEFYGDHEPAYVIMGSLQLAAVLVGLLMSIIYVIQNKKTTPAK